MPRALYRFVRGFVSSDPSHVIVTKEKSWPSQRQVSDYLLCSQCEARFNEKGERWVLKNCYRGHSSFGLRNILKEATPLMQGAELAVYAAAHIPSISVPDLAYFASSVIWRAAVHDWKYGHHELERPFLGERYEEELRLFLLDKEPFPTNAVVWVSVSDLGQEELVRTIVFPYGGKSEGYHLYQFAIPGLRFHFFLGNSIPPLMRRMCAFHSPEHLIYLTNKVDAAIFSDFGKLLATSKPTTKLITVS